MMSAVFGGMAGALISLVVSFIVQQRRLRAEVALKVVDMLQQLFQSIEVFRVQRNFMMKQDPDFDAKAYWDVKQRLREIALNDTVRAQLAIAFGPSHFVGSLEAIQRALHDILLKTWTTPEKERPWNEVREWIGKRMEAIQNARATLEKQLIDASRPPRPLRWL